MHGPTPTLFSQRRWETVAWTWTRSPAARSAAAHAPATHPSAIDEVTRRSEQRHKATLGRQSRRGRPGRERHHRGRSQSGRSSRGRTGGRIDYAAWAVDNARLAVLDALDDSNSKG